MTEPALVMPGYPTESKPVSSSRDLPPDSINLQPSATAIAPTTHLSMCLRPSNSKRMKATTGNRGLSTISGHSTKGSHQAMGKPDAKGINSDSARLAKAEEWFNDINQNAAGVRNAAFPDSN